MHVMLAIESSSVPVFGPQAVVVVSAHQGTGLLSEGGRRPGPPNVGGQWTILVLWRRAGIECFRHRCDIQPVDRRRFDQQSFYYDGFVFLVLKRELTHADQLELILTRHGFFGHLV